MAAIINIFVSFELRDTVKKEKMNNATVNFTSDASTNSKCDAFVEITSLDLCMCSISMLFGLPTHSYIIWLIVRGIGNGVTIRFVQSQSLLL